MTEESMTNALTRLQNRGYQDNFHATASGLEALYAQRRYAPEDLVIDEIVRFEGMSNPDDEAILFAIRTDDGIKGTYACPYGPSITKHDADVVKCLARRDPALLSA